MSSIKNKSPLRYSGGKTRTCKILDKILDEHFNITDFTNLVFPFFGGGTFEFHIQNTYGFNIVANDKFTPLYNFWKKCKTSNASLTTKLYEKVDQISKEDFMELRDKIMKDFIKFLDKTNNHNFKVKYLFCH